MVSSLRNRSTVFQELRYPTTGMAVQSGQDSSCNGRINTLLSLIDEWNDNLIGLVNRISFANCIKPHKRNISTVAVFFFRLYGGGTERVTASHVNLLVEMGYRVILITEEYCPEKEFKISPKVIREFIPYE